MPVKTFELNIGAGTSSPFVGGLNLQENNSNMAKTDSPDCLNVMGDEIGAVTCRDGQEYLYPTSIANGAITGLIGDYRGWRIIGHGTNLYKQQGSSQPVLISGGLSGNRLNMFIFNQILYIIDGVSYKQWDGSNFGNVVPYVPEITISRVPDGSSSTLNENLNLLTGQAIDSFSSNGTATIYQLSIKDVNSIDEVKVNNVVVTTGFTTNLTNGTVTFSVAPTSGTNNVKIKFTKTSLASANTIYACKYSIEYSGRIWLSGNVTYPNRVWKGGVTLENYANYFPALGFSIIGNDQYAVTGFCSQYDKLLIFKEKSIYLTAPLTENNTVVFPYQLLNSEEGCNMPYSIQLVNNNPVFSNTETGVWIVVSTNLLGEKNIKNVSTKINGLSWKPGLLQETNLTSAESFDYGNKYYLCVNGNAYVWDYGGNFNVSNPEKLTWWKYNNIYPAMFTEIIENGFGVLAYGHKTTGKVIKFSNLHTDFGNAIPQHFTTALWITNFPNTGNFKLEIYTDKKERIYESTDNATTNSFDWDLFDWNKFSFAVYRFPVTLKKRIGGSNIAYLQIKISTNGVTDYIYMSNLMVQYRMRKLIRKG
jgi:hypothetical protein